jgi:hypothetical protein
MNDVYVYALPTITTVVGVMAWLIVFGLRDLALTSRRDHTAFAIASMTLPMIRHDATPQPHRRHRSRSQTHLCIVAAYLAALEHVERLRQLTTLI